jgi:thiol:disulfide interchange protein DsbA
MDIASADTAPPWKEGANYFLIQAARPSITPKGKIEVTEVFSYACPFCNDLQPRMQKLKQALPRNAVLDYLPAGFNPNEDWPLSILRRGCSKVVCRPSRTLQSSTSGRPACR